MYIVLQIGFSAVFGVAQSPTKPTTKPTSKSAASTAATSAADDDDIYMKVRALRRSVQEVNAIIETERSVKAGGRQADEAVKAKAAKPADEAVKAKAAKPADAAGKAKAAKPADGAGKTKAAKPADGAGKAKAAKPADAAAGGAGQKGPSVEEPVERASNFRAILTRFNSIGQVAVRSLL
jgi:hypothetical protein